MKKQREHHGFTRGSGAGRVSSEYRAWQEMRYRCSNPERPEFKYYGGRGIRVCERWQNSYAAFLEDMGPKPSGKSDSGRAVYSLDRIDNNRGYEPGNCRWATQTEQSRNRRMARLLTYKNQTRRLAEWAHDLGISRETLRDRVRRHGESRAIEMGGPKGKVAA